MNVMRRVGILLVVVGYGLSFVAVCLAACLAGPMASDHACCGGDAGIRPADRDCCSVTSAVAHAETQAPAAVPMVALPASFQLPVVPPSHLAATAARPFSASPPPILRI
jgi:hypothetical protein